MNDIEAVADIKVLVDSFYEKVRADELLSPVFAARIADDDWGRHLQRMYDFWSSVLLREGNYLGNPFAKHIDLPISDEHFSSWITLFTATVDENFTGERADEAKLRAQKIGLLFSTKLAHIRSHPNYRSLI